MFLAYNAHTLKTLSYSATLSHAPVAWPLTFMEYCVTVLKCIVSLKAIQMKASDIRTTRNRHWILLTLVNLYTGINQWPYTARGRAELWRKIRVNITHTCIQEGRNAYTFYVGTQFSFGYAHFIGVRIILQQPAAPFSSSEGRGCGVQGHPAPVKLPVWTGGYVRLLSAWLAVYCPDAQMATTFAAARG